MTKPILTRRQRVARARQQRTARASEQRTTDRYATIEASTRSSSRSIAHHEASHTLMAAYVGLPWKSVVMLPSPKTSWDQGELWRAKPCCRALVSAAGPAADTLYEWANPGEGEIHAAGSVEDLMGIQSAALQALGLEPTRSQGSGNLGILALTPEQSHKVQLFTAAVQMIALRWASLTQNYRDQVAKMLHEKGQLFPSDLNCPPPAMTEEGLFNSIIAGMGVIARMPPVPMPTGAAPHLARAQMLVSQLAEKAATDPNLIAELERAYSDSR